MNRRTMLLSGAAILVIIIAIAATTSSNVLGGPGEQGDPTEQQQTIEAIVNERFTQTAQAQQVFIQTQTANASTQQGPTQTAAFQQTLDASFNQALYRDCRLQRDRGSGLRPGADAHPGRSDGRLRRWRSCWGFPIERHSRSRSGYPTARTS